LRLPTPPPAHPPAPASLHQRRLRVDPFLPIYTRFQPTGGYSPAFRAWGDISPFLPGPSPVDIPDAKYLDDYTTQITVYPEGGFGPMPYGGPLAMAMVAMPAAGMAADAAPAPAPAPMMARAGPKGVVARAAQRGGPGANEAMAAKAEAGGVAGGPAVRLQSEFKVTPLFAVGTTGPDGTVRFAFKGPQNLGTFTVRAYAASPPGGEAPTTYGAAEASVVVRRGVSLVPSVPRIVRAGDAFEAGVIVSRPGGGGDSDGVSVEAVAGGPAVVLASGKGGEEAGADVAAGGQQELRFKFNAKQVRTVSGPGPDCMYLLRGS
jgi:hypothetical protein